MEKLLNILNLDDTTIKVDVEPWIIKKSEPNIPILRLKSGEKSLIETDTFKGDNNMISYNGKKYWISDNMLEELERLSRKEINLNDYGFSYAEYIDPELVEKQSEKFKIQIENINHLFNSNDDTIIISDRHDSDLHKDLIENVKIELSKYNLEVKNTYLISDSNLETYTEDIPLKKLILVLEKLIGYKIQNNQFLNIPTDQYNKIHFYDNDRKSYTELKTIQETLNKIYFNSSEEMKNIVMEKILNVKPFVKFHHITGNEFNKFDIEKFIIQRPSRLHRFNFFK